VTAALPVKDNLKLYDQGQVEDYLKLLFRHVDLGARSGHQPARHRREGNDPRRPVPRAQDCPAAIHRQRRTSHLKRWAQWHVASFIVPAVLSGEAAKDEKATVDRVAALTAIILDIDSGDTEAKRSYATAALGARPSSSHRAARRTPARPKLHLYWLLNEPSDEVERVAALRKRLASNGRRRSGFRPRYPGRSHPRHRPRQERQAKQCAIVDRCDADYSLDDLAEIIDAMRPMAGIEPPKPEPLPGGLMDFTPNFDTPPQRCIGTSTKAAKT
jgi:hypothetical protein